MCCGCRCCNVGVVVVCIDSGVVVIAAGVAGGGAVRVGDVDVDMLCCWC